MSKRPPLQSIKSGVLSRGMSLAKMSLRVGTQAAGHAVGNFLSAREEGSEERRTERFRALLKSQFEVLSRELGELKGSVMKLGQVLSIYGEHLLPPEANAALKMLQSQSPPLAWKEIEKALQSELGLGKLAELEIDPEPIASASLGQVHRARRRGTGSTGDWEIALKIQYPGVARAIEGDIKTLRYILSATKLIPKGPRYDSVFEEIKEMLYQEVDYEQELRSTQEFRELLKADPRFVVPEVYPQYSSARVLATRLEKGLAVDSPEVAALSQDRRNALGAAALELYLMELYRFGRMQTDPHFGNYRIQIGAGGDRLVLLDFGAVKNFDPAFLKSYSWLTRGAFLRRPDWIESGARELGFIRPEDSAEQLRAFCEFCYIFGEPFTDPKTGSPVGVYDFAASDLPKRAARAGAELALSFKLRAPPPEIIFLDRKMGGAFVFLSVLKVKADLHGLMESYVTAGDSKS